MRIVVHAGMSKTGSTSIQKTLAAASRQLAAAGVLYPELTRHPHHLYLLPALVEFDEARKLLNARDPARFERMVEASERAWDRLAAEVAAARRAGLGTVVLSAEQILGLRKASARRLRDRLAALSPEVEVVGYLRAPAGHYLSSVQQALKFGHRIKPPTTELTYRTKVGKCARLFGGRIALRAFERGQLRGGDVCRDFLEAFLGLAPELAAAIPTLRDNESVSAEGMALLQEYHRIAQPGGKAMGNPASRTLLKLIQAEEAADSYTRPVLHPAIRAVAEAANRRDVLWLRDALGLTFAEFDYAADGAPPAPDAVLEVADICPVDPARLARLRARVLHGLLCARPRPAAPAADPEEAAEAA